MASPTKTDFFEQYKESSGEDKLIYAADYVACHLQEHYGLRWTKCISIVMASSWFNKTGANNYDFSDDPNLKKAIASVFHQIEEDKGLL